MGAAATTVVGAAVVGTTVARVLSKSNQKKVDAVQQKAEAKVAEVDSRAVSDIAAVYSENNMVMEPPSKTSAKIGVITASLGVIGAGAVAAKTKMGSLDIGRIAKIETKAKDDIKSIDKKAGDDIAAIHAKEGLWFDRPGGSRAASVAAAAGLPLKAVKKIASTEVEAESEIEKIDNAAAEEIIAADKKHAIQMHKYAKGNGVTMEFWDGEEMAAATKYGEIEDRTISNIVAVDETAENEVSAIYEANGKTMIKSGTDADYFTARGAVGASATAAAIAAATKRAMQRKENLKSKSRSASPVAVGEEGFLHLAFYDLGATVASAGKAITGTDFEGPAEYDARAHWTPEQRATGCCS